MKKLKQVVGDGLALTIPLLVMLYVLNKAHKLIQEGIAPLAQQMGIHDLFGKLTLALLAALVLALLILAMGLMMRFAVMRAVRRELEGVVLRFFPFLNEFKAMMAERLDREGYGAWKSVALTREDETQFAFLTEEKDGYAAFLVLKGAKLGEGEMVVLRSGTYSYKLLDTAEMLRVVKQYGVGAAALLG